MEKRPISFTMVAMLLTGMFVLAIDIQSVKANTITVPDDYLTIQEAINAANPGDIIRVEAGTYREHLSINKDNLTLLGQNMESIIDGEGSGTVVDVVANNIEINGFTIRNGGPTYFGVRLYHASNSKLTGNKITNNYDSCIYLFGSSNNTISGNDMGNSYGGIVLHQAFNNTLFGNSISNNSISGIRLADSSDNNVVSSNNITSSYWYGVFLGNSSGNVLSANTVASSGEEGALLQDSSNNIITANNLTNNRYGIRLQGSQDNVMTNNEVSYCQAGILLDDSRNNTMRRNVIVGEGAQIGIYLNGSPNNTMNENNITTTGHTISMSFGAGSMGNGIIHNNFVGGSPEVMLSGSANIWDDGYPSGGNYWSDYTGMDLFSGSYQNETGGDGIGDTRYVIDANNTDNYPLMIPYGSILGDVNGDGYVGIDDIFLVATHFGKEPENPDYYRIYDLNGDGYIGVDDIFKTAKHFGEENP